VIKSTPSALNSSAIRFSYPDVVCDSKQGVIPRGLIYEDERRDPHARGAVVVGINPGHARAKERSYYREKGCTYQSEQDYWWDRLYEHPYYRRLRELLNAADIRGPILGPSWSTAKAPRT
jgi:hypothetical protein